MDFDSDGMFVSVSGDCQKHGVWEVSMLKSVAKFARCPTCMQIASEADAARETQRFRDEFDAANKSRRLKATGIPKRFLSANLTDYSAGTPKQKKTLETCRRYAERFNEISENGTSLVLLGKPGCGKTHLACAIVQHVAMNLNKTAVYVDIITMIREVRSTFGKESERTEDDVIEFYATRDLLAIDEVGVQLGSDFEKMIFQDVIDRRYREMLPTIVISNLNVEDLKNVVGDRAVDRLKDNGGALVSFDWASHRGAA